MARIARYWPIKSSSGVISEVQVNGRKDKSQRQINCSAGTLNFVVISYSHSRINAKHADSARGRQPPAVFDTGLLIDPLRVSILLSMIHQANQFRPWQVCCAWILLITFFISGCGGANIPSVLPSLRPPPPN